MRILQLSAHDYKGGASRIAWYLHNDYRKKGFDAYLVVGQKSQVDKSIIEINQRKYQQPLLYWRALHWLNVKLGIENFNYPATIHIPKMIPDPPDIIHAHNLHSKYFDLSSLPYISNLYPTVITMHDSWLLSGHCAYFVECDRWKTGCGKCPDLNRTPAVLRDATSFNWKRKRKIYKKASLNIVTPSRWLMDQVKASILSPSVHKSMVINNGIDLSIFKPVDKLVARNNLSIPQNVFVLLYVVSSNLKSNSYKDYETIERALKRLQSLLPEHSNVLFLGLGEGGETEHLGNLEKRFVPFQNNPEDVAKYYQVADIYIHAANADNFPNVILEALACGTPVIASNVGGISEQIIDGVTGWLVPAHNPEAMAQKVLKLIENNVQRESMSKAAVIDSTKRFSLEKMVNNYLEFYSEILGL